MMVKNIDPPYNLQILYIGDNVEGERFRDAAGSLCWQVTVVSQAGWERHNIDHPDVVVLDNFPESMPSRAAFYHFRRDLTIRFIALNPHPHTLKFIHLNSLSFLRMIHPSATPAAILAEIADLLKVRGKQYPNKGCCAAEKWRLPKHAVPHGSNCQPCC